MKGQGMKFEEAYSKGWPTKVKRPNGSEVLVLGYVRFKEAVVYVDDGYLADIVPHDPIHLIAGEAVERGDSLLVGGHEFAPIEHGEPAAYAWRKLVGARDPETIYDSSEWEARKRYAWFLGEKLKGN